MKTASDSGSGLLSNGLASLEELKELLQDLGEGQMASRLENLVEALDKAELRVVIFGEFNRGKSTLINALLGRLVLPARLVPTTGHVTRVTFGHSEEVRVCYLDGRQEMARLDDLDSLSSLKNGRAREDIDAIEVAVQAPLLRKGMVLIDTPGVSDCAVQTVRARAAVEQADLVLLLLDATQLLGSHERSLATDWITRELDKPLLVVLNRMNLVPEPEREDVRQRLDAWCRQRLRAVLGKPWFEVNALGALRHRLGEGEPPTDDFFSLFQALDVLDSKQRRQIQERSRRGWLLSEIRQLRERNAHTLQALERDAARVERQRREQEEGARQMLTRVESEGKLLVKRVAAFAELQMEREVEGLCCKFQGKANAWLKKHYERCYSHATQNVMGPIETEANRSIRALVADIPDLPTPDPITVRERIILNARIRGEDYLPSGIRRVLGDGITDWLERLLSVDHSARFVKAAKEEWTTLRREALDTLTGQLRSRLARVQGKLKEPISSMKTACRVPAGRIRARAHELWKGEGRPDGQATRHWLRAEAELQARALHPHGEVQQRTALREALKRCDQALSTL